MFKNLGMALRVLRDRAGLSQSGLARRAGMGKSQMSRYENGKELPRLESLERLLQTLGTGPLAFFQLVHVCTCSAKVLNRIGPCFSRVMR